MKWWCGMKMKTENESCEDGFQGKIGSKNYSCAWWQCSFPDCWPLESIVRGNPLI